MAILSVMLLTGCQSTKIEYRVYVPTLDTPVFPLAENIRDNKDGTCEVPSEWIVQLEEFHIKYDCLVLEYQDLKKLYDSVIIK